MRRRPRPGSSARAPARRARAPRAVARSGPCASRAMESQSQSKSRSNPIVQLDLEQEANIAKVAGWLPSRLAHWPSFSTGGARVAPRTPRWPTASACSCSTAASPPAPGCPQSGSSAAQLGVSRTTVTAAYAELRDSGYLHSVRGSGSVAQLPLRSIPALEPQPELLDFSKATMPSVPQVSRAAQWAVEQLPALPRRLGIRSDRPGRAARRDRRPLHRARTTDHARAGHGHERRAARDRARRAHDHGARRSGARGEPDVSARVRGHQGGRRAARARERDGGVRVG